MAARAIYKGTLMFEDVRVPVKLYSAVEDRTVHFRLLHAADYVPVKQRMVRPDRGEPVEPESIRRAARTDEGAYVILRDEELSDLQPASTRELWVTHFVDPAALDPAFYARPYYLGPDGSADPYFALVEALRAEEKQGIVKWVMRKTEYRGALRVEGSYLMLLSMRHAGEVIAASSLPAPTGRDLTAQEKKMAKELVEMLSSDFNAEEYRDEYRDRVLSLIEQKAKGEKVELPKRRAPGREPASLADALRASVKTVRERKVA